METTWKSGAKRPSKLLKESDFGWRSASALRQKAIHK
jgi:hypothetical protein